MLHKQAQNQAMERLCVYVGREHNCCRGWQDRWGYCSPPNAWSPARHTQRPRQQTTHIAWQMCQHFKQLKLPHAESPATESGSEHIFIALLKHAWMWGDTVKRDGGEVLLLPPIIPKITWRDKYYENEWGGRGAADKLHWQGPGSSARAAWGSCWPQLNTALGSLGHSPWPTAAVENEWVNPV